MKKLVTIMALAWMTLALAQNADTYIAAGTNDLVLTNWWGAFTNFNAAQQLSPANEDANALLAVTRLMVLPQTPAGSNFLVAFGFPKTNRWLPGVPETGLRQDANGFPIFPSGYNSATIVTFFRTNVLTAITNSLANLAAITDPNYTLSLSSSETLTESVTVDYGDIQLLRSMLGAAQVMIYTLNENNASTVMPTITSWFENDTFTWQLALQNYPSILTLQNTGDLPASKSALTNAIANYFAASAFIRHRPSDATGRLFTLDGGATNEEAQFRTTLTNVLASLNGPTEFKPGDIFSTINASNWFAGVVSLNSFLPKFNGNLYVNDTFTNYTLSGILPYMPAYKMEEFWRTKWPWPSYAGIYGGAVNDLTFNDPNAGIFAVFVSTNQQATLVGYDVDSYNNIYNQQSGGISAQFTVDKHGNWQFDSNAVLGVSGYGWVGMDGSFGGNLYFTNGDSVELDYGQQLPALGPFQNAAGRYSGTWSGTFNGQAASGTLQGVLTANGQIAFCVFHNGAQNDGGIGQFGGNNQFTTTDTASGDTISGTLNTSTMQITGSVNNSSGSGTWTLNRVGIVPFDTPPVITRPPTNITVSAGSNATFGVTVTGSPPLSYQWYCNGQLLPGSTTTNLVITNASLALNGNSYTVSIENVVGQTSATAILTVVDTNKPAVSITNLAAGQNVSNSTFTVRGTASDPSGVASVWVQLGNGAWTLASTTNGFANWWADVTPNASTNTIHFYAVDMSAHEFVYVADADNNLIRKITSAGMVTTFAGDVYDLTNYNFNGGYADGFGTEAKFYDPTGVAVGSSGKVYVADWGNNLIRMITPAGVVTTLAGDTYDLTKG